MLGEPPKLAGLGGSNRPSLRLEPGEYGDDMSMLSSRFRSLPFWPTFDCVLIGMVRMGIGGFGKEFAKMLGSVGRGCCCVLIWVFWMRVFACKLNEIFFFINKE